MSDDEFVIGIIMLIIMLVSMGSWFSSALMPLKLGRPVAPSITALQLTPFAALILMASLLQSFADAEVQASLMYRLFYLVMGFAWIGLALLFSDWTGISLRDDVGERRNGAAAIVHIGLYMGFSLCFIGGNFGDGPGWWVVIGCAIVSTLAFYLFCAFVQLTTNISERVSIDRDHNAAARFCGLLLGAGLTMGRAVAGDWISLARTIEDFIRIGFLPFLAIPAEAILSRVLPPGRDGISLGYGWIPAIVYTSLGVLTCVAVGPW